VASPGGATWHIFTRPRGALKSPNLSDTWQPLVLPCGMLHDDIIMTCVTLCTFHVGCTDADIICTDADVSSTDVDSSLLTGLG
jgi:hypothetical protein